MDKDKFDIKVIEIEQKLFELNMQMSLFVSEILQSFRNNLAEVEVTIVLCDAEGGFSKVEALKVFFNEELSSIEVYCRGLDEPLFWEDLDLSSKYILLNEIHHKYKAAKIYQSLSDKGMH